MNNQERVKRIRELLEAELSPSSLEISDDSHLHAGHAGARSGKGHFSVKIRSESFEGLSRLKQQQLVFQALGDLMQTDIHALSINAGV